MNCFCHTCESYVSPTIQLYIKGVLRFWIAGGIWSLGMQEDSMGHFYFAWYSYTCVCAIMKGI